MLSYNLLINIAILNKYLASFLLFNHHRHRQVKMKIEIRKDEKQAKQTQISNDDNRTSDMAIL